MKKVLLSLGVVASLAMTSCSIDVEAAADDFCACAEKEGEDKTACHDEWIEKYKGARGSEEQGQELAAKMMECDAMGAVDCLSKIAE